MFWFFPIKVVNKYWSVGALFGNMLEENSVPVQGIVSDTTYDVEALYTFQRQAMVISS